MQIPWIYPEYIKIGNLYFSQTLITSFLSLLLFLAFVVLYQILKKKNPKNNFVVFVDMVIEGVLNFFKDLSGGIPRYAQLYIIFLFVYILWNNWIGVLIDMFANEKVVPFLHHWLRPVSSDIYFNWILAVVWVFWALWYGFKRHGFKFVEKYIPYKWMWMVEEVKGIGSLFLKIVDILIALFIGLLEFVGEFVKILSLTLRLFWNILAWMVLLWLIIVAAAVLWGKIWWMEVPFLLPLIVFVIELFVGFLQALVFSLLVLVYFKLAEQSHH